MLRTEGGAGAGPKTENVQTALIVPRREGSPVLPLPGGGSRKAVAPINDPHHSGKTDQIRTEHPGDHDHLGGSDPVGLTRTKRSDQPNLRQRTLRREKRIDPRTGDQPTAPPPGNAVLPPVTEMPGDLQWVLQTGHQNRVTLHQEQGPRPGGGAVDHLIRGGGTQTDRNPH